MPQKQAAGPSSSAKPPRRRIGSAPKRQNETRSTINYDERRVLGYTEDGTGISLRMTYADVQKVLGSVHRMNKGGNIVVLDGDASYMQNTWTAQKNKIHYENG